MCSFIHTHGKVRTLPAIPQECQRNQLLVPRTAKAHPACMYVYTYVCMYLCMNASMLSCMYVSIVHICRTSSLCHVLRKYALHACMYVCMHVCMKARMLSCMYVSIVCVYIYIYIYIYIYMCVCVCVFACVCVCVCVCRTSSLCHVPGKYTPHFMYMRVCMYVYAYVCAHTFLHVCMQTLHPCICVDTSMTHDIPTFIIHAYILKINMYFVPRTEEYAHTCAHTYIYAYVYTCAHLCNGSQIV